MRCDLLNQLLYGVHNIDMMIMQDLLRHMLGGTHSMDDLQMRRDHLSSINNQILKPFLHVIKEEAVDVVEDDVHFCVYSDRTYYCHVCSIRTY